MKKVLVNLIVVVFLFSCTTNENDNTPKNGDLNNTFVEEQSTLELAAEEKYQREKEKLIKEGWEEQKIENGQLPICYNFKPKKGSLQNHLYVFVGGGTDVSIKVMNVNTNKCVRYVFINSSSAYSIDNIPEGKYYLKIAYGKNWLSKIINGQCVGKFLRNPMYEKGEDIMDFNIQQKKDGYSIPSYRLQLDVVSSGTSNSFTSQNISEDDFNK